MQHVLRDFAAPPTQSADSNSTKTKSVPQRAATEAKQPKTRAAPRISTCQPSDDSITRAHLPLQHFYQPYIQPSPQFSTKSYKQPPYTTKTKHDNLRTSKILPLPRQYRGVLPCATPRQSQKSATFHHIIITRTTRIATRCADDEVCVNSLPSSPFVIQEPVRARIVRGSSAARATAE